MAVDLRSLFSPIKIGSMEVENRIVMPPMATLFAGLDRGVTDRLIDYYVERAKGGVGMIIVESTCVDPLAVRPTPRLGIFKDNFITGLNIIAERVKPYGVKIGVQLTHPGRQAKWLGLGVEEIGELVKRFSEGALRAQKAGFDFIEVHGAHGYLISAFLSPYTNKRTDQYGGNLEGRMRVPLEILREIRKKVGKDFPVSFRINGDDYVEGGLTVKDTTIIAQRLEEEGASVIHVAGAMYESIQYNSPEKMFPVQPMCVRRGCFVHLGEAVKKAVSVPVIVVGRINDPILADEIIRDGKADLVSMGRALIADPELPVKAKEGKIEEIRKCIACNRCISRGRESLSLACSVNAEVGREREYRIERSPLSRNVLVVGGGPSGMEAARVAASRGHTVSLYEEGNRLGGQLLLAAKPPFKDEIENLTQFLTGQLKKLDVQIVLNTKVKADMIDALKPDALILATGSTPLAPPIPDVDSGHVVTAHQILKQGIGALNGRKDVIVVGGGMVGCETAEFIWEESKGQKRITIVEMLAELASDVDPIEREFLIQRLEDKGIQALLNVKVHEIRADGVATTDRESEKHFVKGEFVVLAMGAQPERDLAACLEKKGVNVYTIGDCRSPRRIFDAIHEAAHVARQV